MAGSHNKTSVTYSHQSVSGREDLGQSGEWWIRLEQLDPEQIASDKTTLKEAADIVDAVYELDPCSDPGATGGGEEASTEPPISQEEYTALVRGQLDIPTCEDLENGYRVYLYVFRSNLSFPYELDLSYGEVEKTEHTSETVEEFVVFADESQYSLSKPSFLPDYEPGQIPNLTVEFLTDFYTIEGILENPRAELSIVGSTLNFDQRVTGSLKITYPSRYDVVTILMEAPQDIIVRAFYHGLVVDTDMHPRILDDLDVDDCLNGFSRKSTVRFFGPDDACYQVVEAETRCQCSGDIQSSSRELVVTSCKDDDPSGTIYDYKGLEYTYVDCQETEELHSESFYEETCCNPVPADKTLPLCEERKEIFMGGEEIENGKDYWRAIYGPDTAFIALGPEDQLECGEITHKWIIEDQDCCGAGLPTFEWTQTYDYISWGGTKIFCVKGGAPPYTWETEKVALTIESEWETLDGGCARIKASNCHCKPLYVKVTDACDQELTHYITSDEGSWVVISESEWEGPTLPVTETSVNKTPAEYCILTFQNFAWKVTQYMRTTGLGPREPLTQDDLPWHSSWKVVPDLNADPLRYLPSAYTYTSRGYAVGNTVGVPPATKYYAQVPGGQMRGGGAETPLTFWEWQCPNTPDEMVYDSDNSLKVIADNSEGIVYWAGGKAPFDISLEGQEIYLDVDRTITQITTSSNNVKVYSADSCGPLGILITDTCGSSVEGSFRSSSGSWNPIQNSENPLYEYGSFHIPDDNYWPPFSDVVNLVYSTSTHKVTQRMQWKTANAGTTAYNCDLPCNYDYRCWGYNYVPTTDDGYKLFDVLVNLPDSWVDANGRIIKFYDHYGATHSGPSQACNDGFTGTSWFDYVSVTSHEWIC